MHILVTGGSGFIGINIAQVLSQDSDNYVILYSRSKPPHQAMEVLAGQVGKVVWEQGDVQDEIRLNEVMTDHKIDYVVHAAVITPNAEREKGQMNEIVEVNCLGTLKVLAVAKKHNIKRFVYVSSVAVYGDVCQKEDPVYTTTLKNPTNTYEVIKYTTELLCKRYAELHKVDVVALRLGDVYGAWEYRSGVRDTMSAPCQAAFHALRGETVKLKKAGITGWVYGLDTGRAVEAVLKAKKLTQFAYNCGGTEKWSIVQFCQELQQEFPALRCTVDPEEQYPNVTFFSEADNGLFDMEQLKKDTGFTPLFGLKRGVEDYLRWIKKYPEMILEKPKR